MKKTVFLVLISLVFVSHLTAQNKVAPIKTYTDFEAFQKDILDVPQTQPTLINFWAMWCKPCLEEMPLFYALQKDKNYSNLNFVFVSMDFKKDIETKLRPYITEHNIIENTVILDAPKANTWIDKVSPEWTGALPFTLTINNGLRASHNGKFQTVKDIETLLNKVNFKN